MGAAAEQDNNEQTLVGRRDPLLGTLFDQRFRVDAKIAAGGFGAIYRATHLRSGHEFALKVLHANLTHDSRVVARFRREGAALTRLRDPHTITAYELGETADGTLYIVMELLHGESVYERFRNEGPLAWPRVMAIARSVCSSLAEAHAHGIIHRDLKPTNIHLEQRGSDRDYVKVLDFGIAKIIHDSVVDTDMDATDLTQVGQMIGTLDYMSPEQMVGGPCTGTTDIYTLGIVMYELLAGHKPFEDANSAAAALAAVLTTTPQPLSEIADVPPAVDQLVLRCLERQAGDRFQSAVELANAIEDAVAGRAHLPVTARPRAVDEIPTAPVATAVSVRPAPAAVRAAAEARQRAVAVCAASTETTAAGRQRPSGCAAPGSPRDQGVDSPVVDSPGLRRSSPRLEPQIAPLAPGRAASASIAPADRGAGLQIAPAVPPSPEAVPRPVSPQILPRNRRGSAPQVVPPVAAGPAREPTAAETRSRRGSAPQIVQPIAHARERAGSQAGLGGARRPSSPEIVQPIQYARERAGSQAGVLHEPRSRRGSSPAILEPPTDQLLRRSQASVVAIERHSPRASSPVILEPPTDESPRRSQAAAAIEKRSGVVVTGAPDNRAEPTRRPSTAPASSPVLAEPRRQPSAPAIAEPARRPSSSVLPVEPPRRPSSLASSLAISEPARRPSSSALPVEPPRRPSSPAVAGEPAHRPSSSALLVEARRGSAPHVAPGPAQRAAAVHPAAALPPCTDSDAEDPLALPSLVRPAPEPRDSHPVIQAAAAAQAAGGTDPSPGGSPALRLLNPPPRSAPPSPSSLPAGTRSLREVYPTIHLPPPSAMRPPLSAFDDRPTTAMGKLSLREMARSARRRAMIRRVLWILVAAAALAIAGLAIARWCVT